MASQQSDAPSESRYGPEFATTHWSMVLKAGEEPSTQANAALDALCRRYWYPLYAYVRRRGYDPEEARDLTQEFFSRLLQRNPLGSLDSSKGRFRAWLMASMKHLLANEWKRGNRVKRGGGMKLISLDDGEAEERYQREPVDDATPEKLFERRWAQALLAQVLERLRLEMEAGGEGSRYAELKGHLVTSGEPSPGPDLAGKLGLSVSGVKSVIHRMRRRYAEMFREEIAQTLSSPAELEDEIRHLLAALSD